MRTAEEFLTHFFPHNSKTSTDRIFRMMPIDVRAPILTAWGVRGRKSAFRDDDAKVHGPSSTTLSSGPATSTPACSRSALAGGHRHALGRPGRLVGVLARRQRSSRTPLLKALETAYELNLFDADWFLDNLRGNGGKLRGTDVLAEGLSKADLTEWVRNIHQTQDGSAKGLIAALGWDQIAAETADEDPPRGPRRAGREFPRLQAARRSPTEARRRRPGRRQRSPERKSDTKLEGAVAGAVERKSEPKVEPKPAEVKGEVKPAVEVKTEAKPEPRPLFRSEPKLDPKPVAKVEAPPAAAPPAAAPAPAAAAAPVTAPQAKADGELTIKPASIVVPWTGIQEPKDEMKELAFDEDAILGALKEDELIPISTPGWDEGEDVEVEGLEGTPAQRGARRSKPPGRSARRRPSWQVGSAGLW